MHDIHSNKWRNRDTSNLLYHKFSSIGMLSCVTKRGLVVAPTLAEEDGGWGAYWRSGFMDVGGRAF
jgi:hypothetical protein